MHENIACHNDAVQEKDLLKMGAEKIMTCKVYNYITYVIMKSP